MSLCITCPICDDLDKSGQGHHKLGKSITKHIEHPTGHADNCYQSGKLPLVVTKIKWPQMVPKMDTGIPGGKHMLPEKNLSAPTVS